MPNKPMILNNGTVACSATDYIGHPFEGGLWSFNGGRELLVAALRRPCSYDTRDSVDPAAIRRGRAVWTTWRSVDGGVSWCEDSVLADVADIVARIERGEDELQQSDLSVSGDTVLLALLTIAYDGRKLPVLFASCDGGHSWKGPSVIKGMPHECPDGYAQSSYCVRSDGARLVFMTTTHPNNRAHPCVFLFEGFVSHCILLSNLPQHSEMERVFPSPAMLADGRVVVAVTERMSESPGHTLMYGSGDGGRTWEYLSRANDIGTPAHLLALSDGRLLLTYGFPLPPYRLVARLSDDGGVTWSDEMVLCEGGGSPDLGSARSIERYDGAIVTLYQWNDAGDDVAFRGGRRYLAALVWSIR